MESIKKHFKVLLLSWGICLVFFLLAAILGFCIPRGIIVEFSGQKNIETFRHIFHNNFSVMLQCYILGVISLGLYDFGMIFINGAVIGATINESLNFYNKQTIALYLLPHGVFEIPAIILSMSTGILIWIFFMEKFIRGKKSKINIKIIFTMKCLEIIIGTVYLAISAFIESFVSQKF